MGVPLSLWLKIILHMCKAKSNKDGPEQLSRKELLPESYKTNNVQRSPRTDIHLSSLEQEWGDFVEYLGYSVETPVGPNLKRKGKK